MKEVNKILELLDERSVLKSVKGKRTPALYMQDAAKLVQYGVEKSDRKNQHYLWDPFCGNGSIPYAAGLFFRKNFLHINASDVNKEAVETTKANMERTSSNGIKRWIERMTKQGVELPQAVQEDIANLHEFFLRNRLVNPLPFQVGKADTINPRTLSKIDDESITMIVTDPPYGRKCTWQTNGREVESKNQLVVALQNMRRKLQDNSSIILCMDINTRRGAEMLDETDGYTLVEGVIRPNIFKGDRSIYTLKTVGND